MFNMYVYIERKISFGVYKLFGTPCITNISGAFRNRMAEVDKDITLYPLAYGTLYYISVSRSYPYVI